MSCLAPLSPQAVAPDGIFWSTLAALHPLRILNLSLCPLPQDKLLPRMLLLVSKQSCKCYHLFFVVANRTVVLAVAGILTTSYMCGDIFTGNCVMLLFVCLPILGYIISFSVEHNCFNFECDNNLYMIIVRPPNGLKLS